MAEKKKPENTEILLYQTDDGKTKIEVRLEEETVWLSQKQMAELFQTSSQNITIHIRNIYQEGELQEDATCKDYLQVQTEGSRKVQRNMLLYNLDVIISVGYRVKSHRGTQFRIWATQQLKDFLIKGFVLNDDLLKESGHTNRYFDELLARIRDIRSSEKIFYAKIKDIYSTSVDYDAHHPISQQFFATVQNKMHWAIHGHTAAEIIYQRANAGKPNMGLSTWKNAPHGMIRKTDATVAKNYLNEDELKDLNLIVDQYLSFAELQARNRKPMYMSDWIKKLNDFLTLNEKEILEHAGHIKADIAKEFAESEFDKYHKKVLEEENSKEMKQLEDSIKKLNPKNKKER